MYKKKIISKDDILNEKFFFIESIADKREQNRGHRIVVVNVVKERVFLSYP